MTPTPPCVLAIAGSDSAGGAGIQADLKTMLALGVHGMSVVCAVTAQNSARRAGVLGSCRPSARPGPARLGARRYRGARGQDRDAGLGARSCRPSSADAGRPARARWWWIRSRCRSTATACCRPAPWRRSGRGCCRWPRCVTPNLLEAELLTGMTDHRRGGHAGRGAGPSAALGPRWVLVKGGHLPGNPVDLLFDGAERDPLSRPADRQPAHPRDRLHAGVSHRVVPRPGRGRTRRGAAAKDYVTGAIGGGFPLGAGIGPVDHAWRIRQPVSG